MQTTSCLNPQVIINPAIKENIFDFTHYMVIDKTISLQDSIDKLYKVSYNLHLESYNEIYSTAKWLDEQKNKHQFSFALNPIDQSKIYLGHPVNQILHIPAKINPDDVDTVFLVNCYTGDTMPVYLQVDCRKCVNCRSKKKFSYIQRVDFETQQHESKPLFVTLTYNNKYIPSDGSVSKRDIQLFKKRFNKVISQVFGKRLRYFITSEYSPSGRPHYHLLIFGLPSKPTNFSQFNYWIFQLRLINYCWREPIKESFKEYLSHNYKVLFQSKRCRTNDPYSYGFINASVSRNAAGYVTKYIMKPLQVPDGRQSNFTLISINMGIEFVKKSVKLILSDRDSKFTYLDKFTGKLQTTNLCSYYINKFFPTLSTIIPSELRNQWHLFLASSDYIISKLKDRRRSTIFRKRHVLLIKYPYLKRPNEIISSYHSIKDAIFDFYSSFSYLACYDNSDINDRIKLAINRDVFFSKIKVGDDKIIKSVRSSLDLGKQLSLTKLL